MPTEAELQQELADARNLIAALQAGKSTSGGPGLKARLKKIGASILAALTTPEAIKWEKSLAVVALTRFVILVPAAAVVIDFVIGLLGGPAVKP